MPGIIKYSEKRTPHRQKGVVLIVGLIMLFVMTIISVSSMSGSVLEERMSTNYKDRQVAFQAAEAALRQGERLTFSNQVKTSYTTTCTNGLCLADLADGVVYPDYWTDSTIWSTAGKHITYTVAGTATPAKIIIEYMGCKKTDGITCVAGSDKNIYRITALGYGHSANAQVMLQSTFIP
jgi:type IV pilus assembly protein PilX